jgi:hypothetical protein
VREDRAVGHGGTGPGDERAEGRDRPEPVQSGTEVAAAMPSGPRGPWALLKRRRRRRVPEAVLNTAVPD